MRLAYRPPFMGLLTLLATTVCCFLSPAIGQGQAFGQGPATAKAIRWEADLRAAHARATAENKHLLLHFYNDNCVWCDRLEAGAYQAPQVVEAINQDYVALKIHAGQNPELADTFRVTRFPTDVIVTTQGTALVHQVSPQVPAEYVAMLASNLPAMPAQPQAAPMAPAMPQQVPAANVAQNLPAAGGMPAVGGPTMNPYMQMPAADSNAPGAYAPPAAAHQPAANVPALPVSHRSAVDASALALPGPAAPQPHTLAMDGYCAVTLLEKNEWVEGNPAHGVIHLGQLYLFVDAATMQRFLAAPEPFTPVLNGIDVVRFFEEKRIVPGKRDFGVRDPEHQRMFFFADEASRVHFENQYARYANAAIAVTRQAATEANPQQ